MSDHESLKPFVQKEDSAGPGTSTQPDEALSRGLTLEELPATPEEYHSMGRPSRPNTPNPTDPVQSLVPLMDGLLAPPPRKRGRPRKTPEVTMTQASPHGAEPYDDDGRGSEADSERSQMSLPRSNNQRRGETVVPPVVERGPNSQALVRHTLVSINPPLGQPSTQPPINTHAPQRRRIQPPQEDYNIPHDDSGHDRIPSSTQALHAMKKWDATFSGHPNEDVESFLASIEEGRRFIPIREVDLIHGIPFLLKNGARVWYRGVAHEFDNWEQVKIAFRENYTTPDYQMALREEVMRRTQDQDETVANYFACMRGYFSRLSPTWNASEQVRVTHRNLLAAYRLDIRLSPNATLRELENQARELERIYAQESERIPPPRPEQSICPSLAFQPPRTPLRTPVRVPQAQYQNAHVRALNTREPNVAYELSEDSWEDYPEEIPPEYEYVDTVSAVTPRSPLSRNNPHNRPLRPGFVPAHPTTRRITSPSTTSASGIPHNPTRKVRFDETARPVTLSPQPQRTNPQPQIITPKIPNAPTPLPNSRITRQCWNCDQPGHFRRDCDQPQRLFCHRCRYSGVTLRTCPHCNPGNVQ